VVGSYALHNNLGTIETYINYCDFSLALLEESMFVITSTGIKTCMAKILEWDFAKHALLLLSFKIDLFLYVYHYDSPY